MFSPSRYPDIFCRRVIGPVSVLAGILLLRLVIWKFFPVAETGVKEDLSNLIVAGVQAGAGAAFFGMILRRGGKVFAAALDIPVLGLIAVATLSLCWTADHSVSVRGLLTLAGSAVFYGLTVQLLRDAARVRALLFLMLAMALVAAYYGIREAYTLSSLTLSPEQAELAVTNHSLYYILTHRRVTSFLGWPNSLAGYLALTLPFALMLAFTLKTLWQRLMAGVACAVMVGGLFVTFSFLGWFSFMAASFLMIPFLLRTFVSGIGVRGRVLLYSLAAVFTGLFVSVFLHKDIAESLGPRVIYYKNAFALIAQHPWLGVGWGAFGVTSKALTTSINGLTAYVHNSYVQWWVECGVLGLMAAGIFVVVLVRVCRRLLARTAGTEHAPLVIAVVWAVAAFFIDNLFSFTWVKPNIAVHGWALIGILAALDRIFVGDQGDRAAERPPLSGWLLAVFSAGVLLVTSVFVVALFYYHTGVLAFQKGDVDTAGKCFVQGSLIDRLSASYPATAGDMALRIYQASRDVHYLSLAETNYLEAIRREPLQYAPTFMLGRTYQALERPDKALFYAREAKRLSPFEFNRDMGIIARMEQHPSAGTR